MCWWNNGTRRREESSSGKIRPGYAKSSLGVSPFSVGRIGQGTLTSTPKTCAASCIFTTYLYLDRIILGENKPHRSFYAIDIRLGCHFAEPEGYFLPPSAGNESHPPITQYTQNVSLEPFYCEYAALGAYEQDFTLSSHAFGAFLSTRKSSMWALAWLAV